ncbi:efflux RND transporter periplasmic adaptor subunit [Endozoicomonas arenosclerae]|uniref:efflux RND transporter periplasmic adaptor subunit n=1 Tax=Endozoicomonas arenosclerae TaxID=1633495 RepID=UPI0007801C41|nr:efflux RND transporter periplasmic adaptor subunit [Endozoicomonas arenosclerae]
MGSLKDKTSEHPVRGYLLAVMIAVLLFGSVIGYRYYVEYATNQFLSKQKPPAVPVTAYTVTPESWQPSIKAVGFIEPVQGVTLSIAESGIIDEIHFKSGQWVEEGQEILELDSSVEKANLASSVARLSATSHTLDRTRTLFKKGSAPKSDLDNAFSAYQSLVADIKSLKATIERRRILAPFSGSLGLRNIYLGQYLQSGDAVTVLEDCSAMRMNITIPQTQLSAVEIGMPIKITTDAYPGKVFNATLLAISPVVDINSGTIQIQATVPNADRLLRSGMYATAELILPKQQDVIVIPQPAINFTLYGQMVYVIEKKDKTLQVEQHDVVVSDHNGKEALISKGLKMGDQIVVTGQVRLSNDTPVYLVKHSLLDESQPVPRD